MNPENPDSDRGIPNPRNPCHPRFRRLLGFAALYPTYELKKAKLGNLASEKGISFL
ncbi:hypothetical protein J4G07_16530 [Candidatus Poribacteria bacterium]|nr:hypothetical protein [Candidatus Poribacteria bacterium]